MKKLNIEYIREKALSKGYKLISSEYKNSRTKLDFICDKGHKHSIRWGDLNKRACACGNRIKPSIEFIRQEFLKRNLELISDKYIDSKSNLKYKCKKCGNIHNIIWNCFQQGQGCNICPKKGLNNPNSKGGVDKLNLPLYETYAPQLEKYEQTHLIQKDGLDLLGVNCLYCNKVFVPKTNQVRNRLISINNLDRGELRFYCSSSCKHACPTYRKVLWQEGLAPATSREMQPQFRKMVLERDLWTCQKCGLNKDINVETELHAHHIDPVINNPIESCDVDNGITLCKECHIEIHQIDGCGFNQLKCIKKEK